MNHDEIRRLNTEWENAIKRFKEAAQRRDDAHIAARQAEAEMDAAYEELAACAEELMKVDPNSHSLLGMSLEEAQMIKERQYDD